MRAPLQPPPSPPVSSRLLHNHPQPLGRGGYGMVFAAQMLDTGKVYAIKCMDKRMIKARHATRMIANERDVLASVDHPFIAGLQYAFQDEQEVFFVLDLKAGGDLEHYLLHLNQPFSEDVVRFFAAELLLGLKVRVTARASLAHDPRACAWDAQVVSMATHPSTRAAVPARARHHAPRHQARQYPCQPRRPRVAVGPGAGRLLHPVTQVRGESYTGQEQLPPRIAVAARRLPAPLLPLHSCSHGFPTACSQGATSSPAAPFASSPAAPSTSSPVAPSASTCSLPGSPSTLVGPLTPGTPMLTLSPFKRFEGPTLDFHSLRASECEPSAPPRSDRSDSTSSERQAAWLAQHCESAAQDGGAS